MLNPQLHLLPPEIWHLIFLLILPNTSSSTLKDEPTPTARIGLLSLLHTSQHLRTLALSCPLLWNRPTLPFPHRSFPPQLAHHLQYSLPLPLELTILLRPDSSPDQSVNIDPLVELVLPSLPRIQKLTLTGTHYPSRAPGSLGWDAPAPYLCRLNLGLHHPLPALSELRVDHFTLSESFTNFLLWIMRISPDLGELHLHRLRGVIRVPPSPSEEGFEDANPTTVLPSSLSVPSFSLCNTLPSLSLLSLSAHQLQDLLQLGFSSRSVHTLNLRSLGNYAHYRPPSPFTSPVVDPLLHLPFAPSLRNLRLQDTLPDAYLIQFLTPLPAVEELELVACQSGSLLFAWLREATHLEQLRRLVIHWGTLTDGDALLFLQAREGVRMELSECWGTTEQLGEVLREEGRGRWKKMRERPTTWTE